MQMTEVGGKTPGAGRLQFETRFRLKILLFSTVLLFISQAFNGSLNISSLEKLYINSLASIYQQVVAASFQKTIENAVYFGKPLEKFFGIERLMEEVKKGRPDLDNVFVLLPGGEILYSLDPGMVGTTIPVELQSRPGGSAGQGDKSPTGPRLQRIKGSFYTFLPIRDQSGKSIGSVGISFNEETIKSQIRQMVSFNLRVLSGITIAFMGVLITCLWFLASPRGQPGFSKGRIYAILLISFGSAQLLYSAFNIHFFKSNYIAAVNDKSVALGEYISKDIEFFLKKGIQINRLVKIDVMLNKMVQAIPEIEDVRIIDAENRPLYAASKTGTEDHSRDPPAALPGDLSGEPLVSHGGNGDLVSGAIVGGDSFVFPLKKGDVLQGYLRVRLSKSVIDSTVFGIVLDAITVAVVSLLFVIELILFLLILIKEETGSVLREPAKSHDTSKRHALIRSTAFLFIFPMGFSVSFLPLYMKKLYAPLFGLSESVVLGLPITVEMFCAGIMIITAGVWTDRRGWHEPCVVGILIAAAGVFLSGYATGAVEFILYRGVVGIGYGLAWMSFQGFVFSHTTKENQARGVSNLVAGILSGSICGTAIGGMLVERVDYGTVFYIASATFSLSLAFVLLRMRETFHTARANTFESESVSREPSTMIRSDSRWKPLMHFICNRRVFTLLIAHSVPTALITVGFLYYTVPLYLNLMGASKANTARVIMIYGLCLIYIAPYVSRYVDRSVNKKRFMIAGGIIGGLGLSLFYVLSGFWVTVWAVFLFGISTSLALASGAVFTANLKAAREAGVAKALGIDRAMQRLGQALGPMAMGAIASVAGMERGIAYLGFGYLVLTCIFALGVRQD
jgi:predicted MFS family arabinose efflux permease